MAKQMANPLDEVKDLLRKQLLLDLFKLDLSQAEIAKRLRMDTHTVNGFLKGIKKK